MEREQPERARTTPPTTSPAAPPSSQDYGSRLRDDLHRLADDLRHVRFDDAVRELVGRAPTRDLAGIRRAVSDKFLALWSRWRAEAGRRAEGEPGGAGPGTVGSGTTEPAAPPTGGAKLTADDVRRVIDELGKIYGAMGDLLGDLRQAIGHGHRQGEGMMHGALERARRLVRRRRMTELFDGTEESFRNWRLVGWGDFDRSGERLDLAASADRGLVYFTTSRFGDFVLKLQYRPMSPDFDMSVALRFLDPEQPVPDREEPSKLYSYDNQAYVAVHTGFEVLLGAGHPGARPGTIVGLPAGAAAGSQRQPERAELAPDDWNDLAIAVNGDDYTVRLNGKETARFTNVDPYRGRPADAHPNAGYIGVLLRKGRMAMRHPRIEAKLETRPTAEEHV